MNDLYSIIRKAVDENRNPEIIASLHGDGTQFEAVSRVSPSLDGMWTGILVFKDERFSPREKATGMQFCYRVSLSASGVLADVRASSMWQDLVNIFDGLNTTRAATPQQMPTPGQQDVLPFVLDDLKQRAEVGKKQYGTYLQTHNGRSALWDLYQEWLDGIMYLRQYILEQEGTKPE